MLLFSYILGCSPICKKEVSGLHSVSDVLNACSIPTEITEISCLSGIQDDSLPSRLTAYEQCALEKYIPKKNYIFAKENAIQATKIMLYLQEKKVENTDNLLAKLLNEVLFPTEIPYLSEKKGVSPLVEPGSVFTTNVSNIEGLGNSLKYPLWGTQNKLASPWIVLDENLTIQTVRHYLASAETEKLHFVFQDQSLHYITIHAPQNTAEDVFWENGALSSFPESATRLRLHVSNQETIRSLLPSLTSISIPIELSIDAAPCSKIEGMTCYEGNTNLHTFYIDENPVENCIEPAVCQHKKGTWIYANATCRSHGKRLPSLKEAQKHNSKDVFWTSDWSELDKDGNVICADIYPCSQKQQKKFLSDSSKKNSATEHSGPIFCALDYPTTFSTKETPPFTFALAQKEVSPLLPEPEQAKIAEETIRHDNLNDKGICGEDAKEKWTEKLRQAGGGRSTTVCRDPFSYVTPNEPMRYIWAPYFNNLGEGYAGVGSDQNYDFIAVAKSRWAWLYDYDPNVFRLHKILKPIILHAKDPQEFVSMFNSKNKDKTIQIIKEFYASSSELDQNILVRFFTGYQTKLQGHYTRSLTPIKEMPSFGWLANPENYQYIRTMHQQNRIIPVAGDMLGENGLRSIGDTAKKMNIPIRIYYTSNAPTAWGGQITPNYRKNVASFPFDHQSVVLTTYNSGGFGQKGYWHHNIANARIMQYRINSGYYTNHSLIWDRVPTPHGDMTTVALPTAILGE